MTLPNMPLQPPRTSVTRLACATRAPAGGRLNGGVRRIVHLARPWRARSSALTSIVLALASASYTGHADAAQPTEAACLRVYVGEESEPTNSLPSVQISVVVQGNTSVCRCEMYTNSEGIASLGVVGGGVARVSATLVGFHGKVVEGLGLVPGHPTALNLALKPIPGFDPGVDWKSLTVDRAAPNRAPSCTPTPVPRCCLPPCR